VFIFYITLIPGELSCLFEVWTGWLSLTDCLRIVL
jgi:hypothetical protein